MNQLIDIMQFNRSCPFKFVLKSKDAFDLEITIWSTAIVDFTAKTAIECVPI